MQNALLWIDRISMTIGKAFSFLIIVLVLFVGFDVVMRFVFRSPTGYAFEVAYFLYATLFMVGGAYALARNQHVRGDIFYRTWPVRTQAFVETVLMVAFFFPAVIALVSAGWQFFYAAFQIQERTQTSAVSLPLWPLKAVIPVAGALMLIQGIAEFVRAITALRTGVWPARLSDIEEVERGLAAQEEL